MTIFFNLIFYTKIDFCEIDFFVSLIIYIIWYVVICNHQKITIICVFILIIHLEPTSLIRLFPLYTYGIDQATAACVLCLS